MWRYCSRKVHYELVVSPFPIWYFIIVHCGFKRRRWFCGVIFICYLAINSLSDSLSSIMSTSVICWDVCYTLVLSHILINIDSWKFWAYKSIFKIGAWRYAYWLRVEFRSNCWLRCCKYLYQYFPTLNYRFMCYCTIDLIVFGL